MNNRFNVNEEEKNRIRGLHGIQVINEQTPAETNSNEPDGGYLGEGCTQDQIALGMEPIPGGGCECPPGTEEDETGNCIEGEDTTEDVEEVGGDEITDEEIVNVPDDEDSWLAERWEDLTDQVKNIFSRSKHFAGCSGRGSCPGFNKVSRRRKKRILRAISLNWPKIKWPKFVIRLPKIKFRPIRFANNHSRFLKKGH